MAEEIFGMAGVSKAATAGFFRRLGFPGFRMARVGNQGVAGGKRVFSEPVQRRSGRGDLAGHLASDVQNLIRTN